MMVSKIKMRSLLFKISFFALCIQAPLTTAMSAKNIYKLAAVLPIIARTTTPIRAVHVAPLLNNTKLEKIIYSKESKLITQTQSLFKLHQKSLEKTFDAIIDETRTYIPSSHKHSIAQNSLIKAPIDERKEYETRQFNETKENICKALTDAHSKEIEETEKGNFVAYHAQNWFLHFLADLYKELHSIVEQNKMSDDYIPLRYSSNNDLSHASPFWMNYSIFSNAHLDEQGNDVRSNRYTASVKTSNSFYYFVNNFSIRMPHILLKNIFDEFKAQHYYEKYAKDLEELEKLHSEATVNGNLLLLSFTPRQADRWIKATSCVPALVSYKGGLAHYKTVVFDVSQIINMIKDKAAGKSLQESNVHIDESKCKSRDLNCLTLHMQLTPEILNHKTGPRIYSFNTADPTVMGQYEEKKRQVFDAIKAEMASAQGKR